ncbi:MAG: hypothetical protein ABDH28_05080 [Brevinematia bacterium]
MMLPKKTLIIIFVFSTILLISAIIIYILSEEKRLLSEFLHKLEKADEESLVKILSKISNSNPSKYFFLKGLKDFYDGNEKSAISNLTKAISTPGLSEKEIGASKILIGQYLLLEKKDTKGLDLLTSGEAYKSFPEHVSFIIGMYNFEKGSYEEALEFFIPLTNAQNKEVREEALVRISFIQTAKYGKVSEEIKKQLSEINKELYKNLLTD